MIDIIKKNTYNVLMNVYNELPQYSFSHALIPHQDILLTLSKLQKELCHSMNLIPLYPLWAFSTSDLSTLESTEIFIEKAQILNNTAFFIVNIKCHKETLELKMPIGILKDKNKLNKTENLALKEKINIKIYKTGSVTKEKNSISFCNEAWHKIKN